MVSDSTFDRAATSRAQDELLREGAIWRQARNLKLSPAAALATGTGAVAQDEIAYMASQGRITEADLAFGEKVEEETWIQIDNRIIPADQYYDGIKARLNAREDPTSFCRLNQSQPSVEVLATRVHLRYAWSS